MYHEQAKPRGRALVDNTSFGRIIFFIGQFVLSVNFEIIMAILLIIVKVIVIITLIMLIIIRKLRR